MVEIPNAFGGFAPFPNTIMIPTMGLQSDVIGFRFGFGYEKGKRTLRAMSNEQFNNLNEEAEQAIYKEHDTTAINFFKMEMIEWVKLQTVIIEKSVEIEVMKAIRTPSAMREMVGGFTKGLAEQESGGIIPFRELKDFWDSLFTPKETSTVPPVPVQQSTGRVNPRQPTSTSTPTPTSKPTASAGVTTLKFSYKDLSGNTRNRTITLTEVRHKSTILETETTIRTWLRMGKGDQRFTVKANQEARMLSAYRIAFKSHYGYWV